MNDAGAISLLKQGDIAGLEPLVMRYQVQALRAAFLVTHDDAMAEDVVATAFLRAYDRIDGFDAARPFGPWFLRIVVNDAATAVTRLGKQVSWDQSSPNGRGTVGEATASREPGPDVAAEQAETGDLVERTLKALPPQQRAAIVMKYFLGFREAEIAEQMERSPGTVKRHLFNGRRRLRTLLQGRVES